MKKQCKFCKKTIPKTEGPNWNKRIFCNTFCQQEWWRYKRNKTGDFSKREKLTKAKIIRNNNHLSEQQKQLCYGGLMGDSNLQSKNGRLHRIKFGHCEKQLPYLEWKRKLLNPFIIQEQATKEQITKIILNNKFITRTAFYSYNSIIHQDFTNLFPLFYRKIKGKSIRHITTKTLNLLQPFAILIWYLDDGTLTKDKSYRFYTNAYPLSQQKAMKKWFWHKYRIEVKINYNSTENSYFLTLSVNNSKNLQKIFQPFISQVPECMYYKFLF